MDDNLSPEQNIKKLSKEQKIGVILLLFFGVLAVGLGALQIRNTMYAPFALTSAIPPDVKDAVNDQAVLQFRDTDGDGLSDYDELYVYNTSPYLRDTDSDGIDDKTEILKGSNPNCDESKGNCSGPLYNAGNENEVASVSSTSIDNSAAITDLLRDVQNPAKARELILASGAVDKKTLDQIPDNILMALVQQQTAASFQALGLPFVVSSSTSSTVATSTSKQASSTTP